jgi:hypothetical protein
VRLRELRGFLDCPAEAAVKRHLGLRDEDEPEPVDDEPFYTEAPFDRLLVKEFLQRFTARAVAGSVEEALADWRRGFAELHEEWRLRGRVPEDAFGAVDLTRLIHMAQQRIEGEAGLAAFFRARQGAEFCGPVLLGENTTPVGPRTRFPALRVALPAATVARLVGMLEYAWRTPAAVETLIITNRNKVARDHVCLPMLEPALFFLALCASEEAHPVHGCGRAWLGQRAWHIHIASDEGIAEFCFAPGEIRPEEAQAYLAHLVRDFLDPGGLDLLPLPVVVGDRARLWQAYALEDGDLLLEELRHNFADILRERVAEALEQASDFAAWRPMKLMEIVTADVPATAFDKVRRRFRLLDRAPAKQRGGGRGRLAH